MLKQIIKWIGRIILCLLIFVAGIALIAALMPIETEPVIADAESGAGVRSVIPSYSGLLREFPELDAAETDLVALGQELFFDPILSSENDTSCATCHHPDKGFSDGLAAAVAADGSALKRNTPTLWNVGYAGLFFHDGRADSLEEQAMISLLESSEMNADPDATVAELQAIPEYVALFESAYGSAADVTFENIHQALAAFQRSLTANDTPFDRYAAGDFDALTAAQRRGLSLFRSGATRCFECHANPTFASDTFRVIGVDSDDPGRAEIAEGTAGAFRVPTLRNIALTAPYMHNGSVATLEEVIQFYADGGGRGLHDNEDVDVFVQGFTLNEQEKEDLVAFLHSLTDEQNLPEIPATALSGLPTVAQFDNPVRDTVAQMNIGAEGQNVAQRDPQEITVEAGETVQSAVDRSRPGDTILIVNEWWWISAI